MLKTLYKISKRLLYIIFSLFLLILFLPLLLLVSFLIWISDRGDIFVKEPLRRGLDGEEFRMFKFRTMIPNAHKELIENPNYATLKKEWEKNGNKLSTKEDIRVTWIGRILRKTDVDELPQLINVLWGEMSLVGPRPTYTYEMKEHLRKYPEDIKYLENIFTVRPGMTGIWQVSGRNKIPFHKRLIMDSKYVDQMNLFTDIMILLKTPYIVLTRKGAYE